MRSAVFCYAAKDRETVNELKSYLSCNCVGAIFGEEVLSGAGDDLIDAAERALSADYVLLLLSPDSMPGRWVRERWEPIFAGEARKFGTQIVYLLLRPCEFPRVFRLNRFFDLSENRLSGQRALKRWLLQDMLHLQVPVELPDDFDSGVSIPEALEPLERGLADQPGIQIDTRREIALAFAHSHRDDFEAVFWFNCAYRSRAGILGDLAQALGLRLRGTLEQNAKALLEFCRARRMLLVFEKLMRADRELMICGGSASLLFVSGQTNTEQIDPEQTDAAPRSLTETEALLAGWRHNPGVSLSTLGNAQFHLRRLAGYRDEDWQAGISVGSLAFSLLAQQGRLAEAHEVLEWMTDAMRGRGDVFAAARWDWEKSWILEEWGAPVAAGITPPNHPVQLTLALSYQT